MIPKEKGLPFTTLRGLLHLVALVASLETISQDSSRLAGLGHLPHPSSEPVSYRGGEAIDICYINSENKKKFHKTTLHGPSHRKR